MDITEEYRLIRRAKRNDQDAWNSLLAQHERFIYKTALHTKARGLDREDLTQIGFAAFVKCVQDFDLKRGLRLTTYAYRIVAQKIHQAAQQHGIIFLPHGAKTNCPEPALKAMNEVQSLQMPVSSDRESYMTLGDLIVDRGPETPDVIDQRLVAEMVNSRVGRLNPRERDVVRRRMRGETLREIADDMDVCKERVRQIADVAYEKLKRNLSRKPKRKAAA